MAKSVQEGPEAIAGRKRRVRWWRDARFGLFIHYGLYAQLGRGEWVMNRERIPVREYERLARTFNPKPGCTREWARLARDAGMRYAVLTTKHHEGFCLWDTKQTGYNAARLGPKRDIVREYVDACREFGLRVGLYYSLMDWHHPDGWRCHRDERARRRLVDFTHGCVRELMTNYGKIDILWYDVLWPLKTAERWESAKMNAMVRQLQPDILINNRSGVPEDFGTAEGHATAEADGHAWESCMTLTHNSMWGWSWVPTSGWRPAAAVVEMLRNVIAGDGNLLLNVPPMPDGSMAPEAADCLRRVGRWVRKHRDVVFGRSDRIGGLEGWSGCGMWTRRGAAGYFWLTSTWPRETFSIGGLRTKVKSVALLPDETPLRFTQTHDRLVIRGLPKRCPDRDCGVGVLKLRFAGKPRQHLGEGIVDIGV